MNIIIKPSEKKNKKFDAIINGSKTVSFGGVKENGKPNEDYTIHKDNERKNRYINRHKKSEHWNDATTPGFWSRWLLWEKPTLTQAATNINKKFKNINVKLMK